MFLKIVSRALLFLLLIVVALIFVHQLNDFYKKYLISLIELPNLEINNIEKTTYLKVYSKNGDLIFSQYNNFGGLIDLKTDFDNFEKLYDYFYKITNEDYHIKKLWEEFYQKVSNKIIDKKYEEYLKKNYYQKVINKYGLIDFYNVIANNFHFNNNIKGINGLSFYLFGQNFADLEYKEKVFLLLAVLFDYDNPVRHFSYLEKLSTKFTGDERLLRFKYPKTYIKYNDYVEGVLKELKSFNIDYKNQNIVVYSNLDEVVYQNVKKIIKDHLYNYDGIEASAVVINYNENIVITTIGTINNDFSKNRAIFEKREVGSVFKPITYLTAFTKGVRPSYVMEDKPYIFNEGRFLYRPKNFKDFYMGKTNIRNGLIYSLNNLTIKLAEKVGLKKVAYLANKIGFEDIKPFYAMPLGSIPQAPFTVAKAFGVIANYGQKCNVSFINKIQINGVEYKNDKRCVRVVDEKSAYQTLFLMKKVVRYGTARGAGLIPGTAGKTGTSNDSKDCWFVAIFPPFVVVLWVGYDDYRTIDEDATGGSISAPIVAKIEKYLLKGGKKVNFKVPKGIVLRKVVKNEDILYSEGCGSYYYEMLKEDNLPKSCDDLNFAKKE